MAYVGANRANIEAQKITNQGQGAAFAVQLVGNTALNIVNHIETEKNNIKIQDNTQSTQLALENDIRDIKKNLPSEKWDTEYLSKYEARIGELDALDMPKHVKTSIKANLSSLSSKNQSILQAEMYDESIKAIKNSLASDLSGAILSENIVTTAKGNGSIPSTVAIPKKVDAKDVLSTVTSKGFLAKSTESGMSFAKVGKEEPVSSPEAVKLAGRMYAHEDEFGKKVEWAKARIARTYPENPTKQKEELDQFVRDLEAGQPATDLVTLFAAEFKSKSPDEWDFPSFFKDYSASLDTQEYNNKPLSEARKTELSKSAYTMYQNHFAIQKSLAVEQYKNTVFVDIHEALLRSSKDPSYDLTTGEMERMYSESGIPNVFIAEYKMSDMETAAATDKIVAGREIVRLYRGGGTNKDSAIIELSKAFSPEELQVFVNTAKQFHSVAVAESIVEAQGYGSVADIETTKGISTQIVNSEINTWGEFYAAINSSKGNLSPEAEVQLEQQFTNKKIEKEKTLAGRYETLNESLKKLNIDNNLTPEALEAGLAESGMTPDEIPEEYKLWSSIAESNRDRIVFDEMGVSLGYKASDNLTNEDRAVYSALLADAKRVSSGEKSATEVLKAIEENKGSLSITQADEIRMATLSGVNEKNNLKSVAYEEVIKGGLNEAILKETPFGEDEVRAAFAKANMKPEDHPQEFKSLVEQGTSFGNAERIKQNDIASGYAGETDKDVQDSLVSKIQTGGDDPYAILQEIENSRDKLTSADYKEALRLFQSEASGADYLSGLKFNEKITSSFVEKIQNGVGFSKEEIDSAFAESDLDPKDHHEAYTALVKQGELLTELQRIKEVDVASGYAETTVETEMSRLEESILKWEGSPYDIYKDIENSKKSLSSSDYNTLVARYAERTKQGDYSELLGFNENIAKVFDQKFRDGVGFGTDEVKKAFDDAGLDIDKYSAEFNNLVAQGEMLTERQRIKDVDIASGFKGETDKGVLSDIQKEINNWSDDPSTILDRIIESKKDLTSADYQSLINDYKAKSAEKGFFSATEYNKKIAEHFTPMILGEKGFSKEYVKEQFEKAGMKLEDYPEEFSNLVQQGAFFTAQQKIKDNDIAAGYAGETLEKVKDRIHSEILAGGIDQYAMTQKINDAKASLSSADSDFLLNEAQRQVAKQTQVKNLKFNEEVVSKFIPKLHNGEPFSNVDVKKVFEDAGLDPEDFLDEYNNLVKQGEILTELERMKGVDNAAGFAKETVDTTLSDLQAKVHKWGGDPLAILNEIDSKKGELSSVDHANLVKQFQAQYALKDYGSALQYNKVIGDKFTAMMQNEESFTVADIDTAFKEAGISSIEFSSQYSQLRAYAESLETKGDTLASSVKRGYGAESDADALKAVDNMISRFADGSMEKSAILKYLDGQRNLFTEGDFHEREAMVQRVELSTANRNQSIFDDVVSKEFLKNAATAMPGYAAGLFEKENLKTSDFPSQFAGMQKVELENQHAAYMPAYKEAKTYLGYKNAGFTDEMIENLGIAIPDDSAYHTLDYLKDNPEDTPPTLEEIATASIAEAQANMIANEEVAQFETNLEKSVAEVKESVVNSVHKGGSVDTVKSVMNITLKAYEISDPAKFAEYVESEFNAKGITKATRDKWLALDIDKFKDPKMVEWLSRYDSALEEHFAGHSYKNKNGDTITPTSWVSDLMIREYKGVLYQEIEGFKKDNPNAPVPYDTISKRVMDELTTNLFVDAADNYKEMMVSDSSVLYTKNIFGQQKVTASYEMLKSFQNGAFPYLKTDEFQRFLSDPSVAGDAYGVDSGILVHVQSMEAAGESDAVIGNTILAATARHFAVDTSSLPDVSDRKYMEAFMKLAESWPIGTRNVVMQGSSIVRWTHDIGNHVLGEIKGDILEGVSPTGQVSPLIVNNHFGIQVGDKSFVLEVDADGKSSSIVAMDATGNSTKLSRTSPQVEQANADFSKDLAKSLDIRGMSSYGREVSYKMDDFGNTIKTVNKDVLIGGLEEMVLKQATNEKFRAQESAFLQTQNLYIRDVNTLTGSEAPFYTGVVYSVDHEAVDRAIADNSIFTIDYRTLVKYELSHNNTRKGSW